MKNILFQIGIIILGILLSSCSDDEPPPLNDYLIGTYGDVSAYYQPDSTNIHNLLITSSTEATYLKINSNGSYKMILELAIEGTNEIINIIQEGSYTLTNTRWAEADDMNLSHWEGTIEFNPVEASSWGGQFSIMSSVTGLYFKPWAFINIPNYKGRFLIVYWDR
jgi:hypothetical protein